MILINPFAKGSNFIAVAGAVIPKKTPATMAIKT